MKIKSCGIILFIKQNNQTKFLLIRQNVGHWSFPKGKMEKDETELETALRELREETGITECKILNDLELVDNYTFKQGDQEHVKSVKYFVGEIKNPDVKLLKSELMDYIWLEFDEAMKLITHESTKELFEKFNERMK